MRVLDLIDEILLEIDNGRKSLFSNKKTIDTDYVLEVIEEIRDALPEDLAMAREVLENEEMIIFKAQEKAKNVLDGVDTRLEELINENKVTQLAYERANATIDNAKRQAHEIMENANDYAINVLDDLSSYMKEYIVIVRENKSNFISKKNMQQSEF